jgi:hypothetical protein
MTIQSILYVPEKRAQMELSPMVGLDHPCLLGYDPDKKMKFKYTNMLGI